MSNKTIWKAQLEVSDDVQVVTLPSQFSRTVSRLNPADNTEIEVWFECDPEGTPMACDFRVIGTGHPAPTGLSWIGTVFDEARGLVWHIYIGVPYVIQQPEPAVAATPA